MSRPKVVYVVTEAAEQVRVLLAGQLGFVARSGFDVTVVASPGPDLAPSAEREGVAWHAVPMRRDIAPWADAAALLALYRLLRRIRPDVVVAGSPKAGLLGTLAAFLARTPGRIYHLRTLRLETIDGPKRQVLRATERIASRCATKVLAISPSLRDRYTELGLCGPAKMDVIGAGSSNGIDVAHFRRDDATRDAARRLASELGLGAHPTIGFVGRFTRDKGIADLLEVFERCRAAIPDLQLLLVGKFDTEDALPASVRGSIERTAGVFVVPWMADTATAYLLMDVFCFPSRREGFGNVLVEAAAMGVPVVAYDTVGVRDAVAHGQTGRLVPLGDAVQLGRATLAYLCDPELRRADGAAGAERARTLFARERIWAGMVEVLESELPPTRRVQGAPRPS